MTIIFALIGLILNIWGFTSIARISATAADSYKIRTDLIKMTLKSLENRLNTDDGIPGDQKRRWIREWEDHMEDAIQREKDFRSRAEYLSSFFNRLGFFTASFIFLFFTAVTVSALHLFVSSYERVRQGDDFLAAIFLILFGFSVAFVLFMSVALVIRRTIGMSGASIHIRTFTCWLLLYASIAFCLAAGPNYYFFVQNVLVGAEAIFLTIVLYIGLYLLYFPSFTMTCFALCENGRARFEFGEIALAFLKRKMPIPAQLNGYERSSA